MNCPNEASAVLMLPMVGAWAPPEQPDEAGRAGDTGLAVDAVDVGVVEEDAGRADAAGRDAAGVVPVPMSTPHPAAAATASPSGIHRRAGRHRRGLGAGRDGSGVG